MECVCVCVCVYVCRKMRCVRSTLPSFKTVALAKSMR